MVYDEATNILAYQQADNSKELLVDAATMKLVAAIEVEGKELERPVTDGKGNLYLPLRDTHAVYKIDLKARGTTTVPLTGRLRSHRAPASRGPPRSSC